MAPLVSKFCPVCTVYIFALFLCFFSLFINLRRSINVLPVLTRGLKKKFLALYANSRGVYIVYLWHWILEYSFNTIPIAAVVDVQSRGLQVYQLLDSFYNCNCQISPSLNEVSTPLFSLVRKLCCLWPTEEWDAESIPWCCVLLDFLCKNLEQIKKKKKKTIVNSTHSWYFHFFICKKKKKNCDGRTKQKKENTRNW